MKSTLPQQHERLFDEITGKLNELSLQSEAHLTHHHLRISQEELKSAQNELREKIKSLEAMSFPQTDQAQELKRVTEQLEQERLSSSKLSTDLAKSLEMNLRMQYEVEEARSKAHTLVMEERKINQILADKNRALSHELDLSQALQNEVRLELCKAKDSFQEEQLQQQQEIERLNGILEQFEEHAIQQNAMMKNLADVAEKKLIELKLALDRKTLESQDYFSHLQQAMTQLQVLRQENVALKEYLSKMTNLNSVNLNSKTLDG